MNKEDIYKEIGDIFHNFPSMKSFDYIIELNSNEYGGFIHTAPSFKTLWKLFWWKIKCLTLWKVF